LIPTHTWQFSNVIVFSIKFVRFCVSVQILKNGIQTVQAITMYNVQYIIVRKFVRNYTNLRTITDYVLYTKISNRTCSKSTNPVEVLIMLVFIYYTICACNLNVYTYWAFFTTSLLFHRLAPNLVITIMIIIINASNIFLINIQGVLIHH